MAKLSPTTKAGAPHRQALGYGVPNRLWAAALFLLAAALYVAVNRGPDLLALAALVAAAALLTTYAALQRVQRTVSVERGDVVLSMCLLGISREVDRVTAPRRLHVSAACVHPGRYPDKAEMEVRVVSDDERLSWIVHGVTEAEQEALTVRDLVARAGLRLARAHDALRGSLVPGRHRSEVRFSWPAAAPSRTPLLICGLALTFVAMLVETFWNTASIRVAMYSVVLTSLVVLAYVAGRASSARAWLEIDDHGWAYGRQRIWGRCWARGGAAALPGRVILLRQRSLPAEYALLSRDGTPALTERELTPPEMRWLATQVVDWLDARQRRQRAA